MTLGAWCCAELIRYAFYGINTVDTKAVPFPLVWLRYSGFLILYPIGVSGEMLCAYHTLPLLQKGLCPSLGGLLAACPPHAETLLYVFLLCYLPGLPFLYLGMLGERKKRLYPKPAPKLAGVVFPLTKKVLLLLRAPRPARPQCAPRSARAMARGSRRGRGARRATARRPRLRARSLPPPWTLWTRRAPRASARRRTGASGAPPPRVGARGAAGPLTRARRGWAGMRGTSWSTSAPRLRARRTRSRWRRRGSTRCTRCLTWSPRTARA